MRSDRTRRSLLRATTGAAAAAGVAGLAGCSALPALGGGGGSPARDWLYDPTGFVDDPVVSIRFESPARIDAEHEHLHPEVRSDRETPPHADGLEPAATDWALVQTDDLLKAPLQYAYGGSFGEAAAREAATAAIDDDVSASDTGEVADLHHVTAGSGTHGAYREGLAVSAANATGDAFETLVTGAADGTDRLAGVADEVATFLDALAFEHAAQCGLSPAPDSGAWQGFGTDYRIDGAATTLRFLTLNQSRWDEASLETFGERVDGLREVSVDGDAPVLWVEGVADTDRVGLRGELFPVGELPYG